MDIKRFFDSVDHEILKNFIRNRVQDENLLLITDTIIDSFTKLENKKVGIPLGNVTSQLFANIYLHPLDTFVKQVLREKYYLRYCDDFIILSNNQNHLMPIISTISEFLKNSLRLALHPNKIIVRKLNQGIDFIGYVLFSDHILLRTRTKQRIKKQLKKTYDSYLDGIVDSNTMDQQLQSYLGILSHANEYKFSTALKNAYWIRS